jgi:N4-gp56 family major capsid protein
MKEDFRARDTGTIIFSEVYDTAPNYNALSETGIWLTGSYLDSRTVSIGLEIHGDVLKISDYNELVNFWNNGDLRSLVRGKLGQNQVDYLDILARNAFLSVDDNYKIFVGTGSADRFDVTQADVFDPDLAELVRVHLEEREIPGVVQVADSPGQVVVCATTPRVIYDIRTGAVTGNNDSWLEVQEYEQTGRKFTAEAGMWAGVRFVRTNRLKLFNAGTSALETTIPTGSDTVVGQGAAATVDTVYTVGQSGATAYIDVADSTGFSVGDVVTICVGGDDGAGGHPAEESDGTQETRRIVAVDSGGANRLSFDKPLLKPHAAGAYVVNGVDISASIFMGGPAVVYGVGERPHPTMPPKIDDLQMVQRYGWRGFLKFQIFRPEWLEVVESGGSVT